VGAERAAIREYAKLELAGRERRLPAAEQERLTVLRVQIDELTAAEAIERLLDPAGTADGLRITL
jgi:hypothetical protein